jgi:dynein heavy chain 2
VSEKVEDWLEQLANEMRATLSNQLVKCLQNTKAFDWGYPSQIQCLACCVKFTEDAEAAFREGSRGLAALKEQTVRTLREFTSHDLSSQPLLQLKMKSLVFDLVHNLDVVEQLQKCDKKSIRVSDWVWSKQLRYYMEKGKGVVRMHDARFDYTYEYQGNAPRLVHTPLTDR